MSSAYAATLRDYPRRVRFPVVMVLAVLFSLPVLMGYMENADWTGMYAFLVGCLILPIWVGLISGHLKQVLAKPQGRLLPAYAATQVRVALLLIAPAFLACVGGALLVGFRPLGAIAMALFLASLYWTWPYLFDRGGLLMLFSPIVVRWLAFLAQDPRVQNWPRWANLGLPEDILFSAVIAITLALIGFVTWRMLHLTESSFEYQSDPSLSWRPGSSPDSDAPFITFFQRLVPWFGRYRIQARSSIHGAGWWERVAHWRRGMGPRAPIVSGLSMAGITALVGVFFMFFREDSTHFEAGLLLAYLYMFPFARYSYTQRRRDLFSVESLFPGSRERFVREMGLATAIDILSSWFFLCLGVAAVRALGLFASVPWETFLVLVWLSLGATLFGIGIVPWALQLNGDKMPSFALNMIVLIVGLSLTVGLYKMAPISGPVIWLTGTPILAAIGAFSGWHGYRRWCSLELGRNEF